MDKPTRNLIQSATQDARRLLEQEFREQLQGTFDVMPDTGAVAPQPGAHLDARQRFIRSRIVAAIRHERAKSAGDAEAVQAYLREAAFTTLNRFAALKLMEARRIVQECVSRGEQSAGFREFAGLAPGLATLPDHGYRLYLECLFDEIGTELGVLFDRRDPASLLWPRRQALLSLLDILNRAELAAANIWAEDETIGWIYQYFNSKEEREAMRDPKQGGSAAPRNSRELAVRNQFFTPRYVVQFLTDNTLGRIWYEMTKGQTKLKDQCRYLVRRPHEYFLHDSTQNFENLRPDLFSQGLAGLPEDPTWNEIQAIAFSLYGAADQLCRDLGLGDVPDFGMRKRREFESTGKYEGTFAELFCCLYFEQRDAKWSGEGDPHPERRVARAKVIYQAVRASILNPQPSTLNDPVFVPHRPLKDPRQIRMLDPACGSMHFGLYAFDLYEIIYAEAWDNHPELLQDLRAELSTLNSQPSTPEEARAAFLRLIPKLIIEHNIHGIDIDPRAVQIAGLSLWLRAQRAWQAQGVNPAQRPAIRKSNVVCAEPMPGEPELLREFVEQEFPAAERPIFAHLLAQVFDRMKLAGEAGSLLKIEKEIRSAISEARAQWHDRRQEFFDPSELANLDQRRGTQRELASSNPQLSTLNLSGISDDQFWKEVEERIYASLRAYAAHAANGGGFQRRLFAEDAARGFAFIDICRNRYDVALMNPPFGDASLPSKSYLDDTYGDTKGDVYKAFVECFHDRLIPSGMLGIISSRAGFFLGQSEDWRTRVVLRLFRPIALADLGMGVLDAMVEVAAYVLRSLSEAEARDLTLSLVPVLEKVVRDKQDRFSLPKWQAARNGLKRHQAVAELERLEAHDFIQRCPGDIVRYTPLWHAVKKVAAPPEPVFPPLMCIRALAEEDKASVLGGAIHNPFASRTFSCDPSAFGQIPGSPFAYWASKRVHSIFKSFARFGTNGRTVRQGMATADDKRFLRSWWEVPAENCLNALAISWQDEHKFQEWCDGQSRQEISWFPIAKGGEYRPFYSDLHLVGKWHASGAELSAFAGSVIRNPGYYFRPGYTYPLRTSRLCPQVMPAGCLISVRGSGIYGDISGTFLALLASQPFDALIKMILGRFEHPQFDMGDIVATPIPEISPKDSRHLAQLGLRCVSEKRILDAAEPTSHAYRCPALLSALGATLAERAAAWAARVRTSEETVVAVQAEIDGLALRLYGLDAADRAALTATLATGSTADAATDTSEDETEEAAPADTSALAADLLAHGLGAAFGRWDIRYATGKNVPPELADPFAPLPVCAPGMLQNAQGLPARPEEVPANYPLRITWSGILADDPKHPEDIERRVREAIEVIWPDRAPAIENEACELLGATSLRDYFRKSFFPVHLSRYSKSRRQAPIYLPLSTPSASYTIWLYYHRFTKDTFYRVQEIATEKLAYEERKLTALHQDFGPEPTAGQREQLANQESFVQEMRAFREEIARVAPLWNPDLNDGVIINFAPLWRLIAHRPWQKDVKACWDSLVAQEYDWSHLAIHLWPERVVPKCQTDRSLAIAHGLDEVFWEEDEAGKAKPKKVTKPEIQKLIAERTSPAVKEALQNLLGAPVAGGGNKRSRK